jgi:hypothetical protein
MRDSVEAMSRSILLAWVVLAACTRAETRNEASSTAPPAAERPGVVLPPAPPAPPPPPSPPPPPPPVTHTAPAGPTAVSVEITAVTLADDCGGSPPASSPPSRGATKRAAALKADEAADTARYARKAKRRCEQTSMQLSVTAATTGTPTRLEIRKVELFDDAGALVGVLAASSPTRWSDLDRRYAEWDETIASGQDLSVSYVLSQPDWRRVSSRWNRTYTLQAVVVVSGRDTTVQKDVVISAPTALPPNVRT